MAKSTKATVARRIQDVYDILLEGGSRQDVLQYASEKEWGVTERTVDEYIAKSRRELELDLSERRDQILDKCRKRRNYLWHMAKRSKNLAVMIQLIKDEQLLVGAYPESESALQIRREFDEYREMAQAAIAEARRLALAGPVVDAEVHVVEPCGNISTGSGDAPDDGGTSDGNLPADRGVREGENPKDEGA